jgi:hypothetical protein
VKAFPPPELANLSFALFQVVKDAFLMHSITHGWCDIFCIIMNVREGGGDSILYKL